MYTRLPWIAMVIILLCSILLEHTAAFILLVWCQNCSMLLIFRSSCIFLRFVSVECYAWICARAVRTERIHLSPWMFFVLGWLRKEEVMTLRSLNAPLSLKRRACLPSLHEKRVTQNISLANVTIVTACRMSMSSCKSFSSRNCTECAAFERNGRFRTAHILCITSFSRHSQRLLAEPAPDPY